MKDHQFVGTYRVEARTHWKADGRPKRKMRRAWAEKVAARTGQDAYRCPRCGHYHVGTLA